jgi:hypothetical protein
VERCYPSTGSCTHGIHPYSYCIADPTLPDSNASAHRYSNADRYTSAKPNADRYLNPGVARGRRSRNACLVG